MTLAAKPSDRIRIFDGHNDALLELYYANKTGQRSFLSRTNEGHLDLPRAAEAGFAGGLFAICVPNDPEHKGPYPADLFKHASGYEMKMAPAIEQAYAEGFTLNIIADLNRISDESRGRLRIARTVADIENSMQESAVSAMIHLEGADAVAPDLSNLTLLYQHGIRSIGIVWSRPNAFGHGVPFKFPSSPDTGPGLTPAGKKLVAACNEMGIMVDLAHLNERGFYDVAEITSRPLVSTHTAAHALCPTARNLTDDQLDVIGKSDGLVGVTFFVGDLHGDGEPDSAGSLDDIVRHVEYIAGRIGVDHVALGSDFDGATIPRELDDVTGLPRLLSRLENRGFDRPSLEKIALENWLRILRESLQPSA